MRRDAGRQARRMAGTLHQGILALFQDDPWLAFDLLGIPRPVVGTPIDRRAEVERDGEEPWTVRQGFPDLVLVHGDERSAPDERIVITVEAQSELDKSKRYMIPVYQSHLAEEHESQAWAIVVSLSEIMSNALRAWGTGPPPKVDVLLLDVRTVPKSPWLDEPALRPTAAVLVGALHGYAGDFEAARIGFQATRWLPAKRRHRHGMTILAAVSKEQREQLLKELPMQERNPWIEVERRSGTYQVGREEGLEQGREQGLEQGRAALLELMFELLAHRGIAIDAAGEAQIRGCRDLEVLQRWARRAMDATSLDELFEPA
jgi:hypothetical protein